MSAPVDGCPVQVVRYTEENNVPKSGHHDDKNGGDTGRRLLELNEPVLRSIIEKSIELGNLPIGVIAIAGPSRCGKSFILSQTVKYLTALEKGSGANWTADNDQNGFHLIENGGGMEDQRTTQGIWMWSRPFIISRNNSAKKMAVLLMDTEGCFNPFTSEEEATVLMGLSLVASSCFIFNESHGPNEKSLSTISKCIQLVKSASQTGVNQKLLFLVRDWSFSEHFPHGAEGGRSFLKNYLSERPQMTAEAVENRQILKTNFKDHDAYLMPYPDDLQVGGGGQGHGQGLATFRSPFRRETNFQTHVTRFVKGMVADLAIKIISGSKATGKDFYESVRQFVDILNTAPFSSPVAMLKCRIEGAYKNFVNDLSKVYESTFRKQVSPLNSTLISPEALQEMHETAKNVAISKFDQCTLFSTPSDKQMYGNDLDLKIEQIWSKICAQVKDQNKSILIKAEQNGLATFRRTLDAHRGDVDGPSTASSWTTQEQLNNVMEVAERLATHDFMNVALGSGDEVTGTKTKVEAFERTMVPEFLKKLDTIKKYFCREQQVRLKNASSQLGQLMVRMQKEYLDEMRQRLEEDDDEYKKTNLIQQWHQSICSRIVGKYREQCQQLNHPENVCLIHVENLQQNLNKEFDQIVQENEAKLAKFESKCLNAVQFALTTFRIKSADILSDLETATEEKLRRVHKDVLDIATECLDEEDFPDSSVRKKCREQLKNLLEEALKDSMQIVVKSEERKRIEFEEKTAVKKSKMPRISDGYEIVYGILERIDGLEYFRNFEENKVKDHLLQNLTDSQLERLLPPLGLRIEFQKAQADTQSIIRPKIDQPAFSKTKKLRDRRDQNQFFPTLKSEQVGASVVLAGDHIPVLNFRQSSVDELPIPMSTMKNYLQSKIKIIDDVKINTSSLSSSSSSSGIGPYVAVGGSGSDTGLGKSGLQKQKKDTKFDDKSTRVQSPELDDQSSGDSIEGHEDELDSGIFLEPFKNAASLKGLFQSHLDYLCKNTVNVAEFALKLKGSQVLDDFTYSTIMERQHDDYTRNFFLYKAIFMKEKERLALAALTFSGNDGVLEFLKKQISMKDKDSRRHEYSKNDRSKKGDWRQVRSGP